MSDLIGLTNVSSLRCSAEEIPNTKGETKGPENRQNPFATLALIKTQHIA